MEEDDDQQQKPSTENRARIVREQPVIFGEFTPKESWDMFFTIRGADDFSEWYVDWPQLQALLTHLLFPKVPRVKVRILVPGCGDSRMSENLYDNGFTDITNIDFSRVVITAMLRRNVKERPLMKWRVMDMTSMQFPNGTFDAIIDKGGLDALVESELGSRLRMLYLSEVKRLLKAGGKYICLTSPEPHALGLLLPKFRFGWKINIYATAQESLSGTTRSQTFIVVAEKDVQTKVSKILTFADECFLRSPGDQVHELSDVFERENMVRAEYSNGSDIWYSVEDMNLGLKGNLRVLEPGRTVKLVLGEAGVSRFFYTAVLLDAPQEAETFSIQYLVSFYKSVRSSKRILSSDVRQWMICHISRAARSLMIFLDSSHYEVSMGDILKDVSPFINQLCPGDKVDPVFTPMCAGNGVKQQQILHKVTSALTGPIIVDNVIYIGGLRSGALDSQCLPKKTMYRRISFERTESVVQSEARLYTEGPKDISSELMRKNAFKTSSGSESKINHKVLASDFHYAVIAGLMLFSIHSKRSTSAGGLIKTLVIGLGAGLLPLFMRNYVPSLMIEVVEPDPMVFDAAKDFFGFKEDERLKVHFTDAIKFVSEKANSEEEGNDSTKVDVLVVDVDSTDSSSGLICPEADFLEESFLLTVKDSLSEKGLFIFNLVSCFGGVRAAMHSKLTKVFSNVFCIVINKEFSEAIFALKRNSPIEEGQLAEACEELATSLRHRNQEWVARVLNDMELIKQLDSE